MATKSYTLTGIRGGQGTTTTALLFAHNMGGTFCSTDPNAWAVAGKVEPKDVDDIDGYPVIERFGDGPVVVDIHEQDHKLYPTFAINLAVVRNDYVSALLLSRSKHEHPVLEHGFDGFVLLREKGRALMNDDMAQAVGIKCVAVLDVDPMIARAYDAGLLTRRRLDVHTHLVLQLMRNLPWPTKVDWAKRGHMPEEVE